MTDKRVGPALAQLGQDVVNYRGAGNTGAEEGFDMEDLMETSLEDVELTAAIFGEDDDDDEGFDPFGVERPFEISWDEPDEDEAVWL